MSAELTIATPVAVVCTANATVFPLGVTANAGDPLYFDSADITFHESDAASKGMLLELAQWDTQGTSGTDVDARFNDSRITSTPPDGQYNMSGTSTSIPNTNKVPLLDPFHLHPNDKVFRLDLRGLVLPAGKTAALSVANPSGNVAPNCTVLLRMSRSPLPAAA